MSTLALGLRAAANEVIVPSHTLHRHLARRSPLRVPSGLPADGAAGDRRRRPAAVDAAVTPRTAAVVRLISTAPEAEIEQQRVSTSASPARARRGCRQRRAGPRRPPGRAALGALAEAATPAWTVPPAQASLGPGRSSSDHERARTSSTRCAPCAKYRSTLKYVHDDPTNGRQSGRDQAAMLSVELAHLKQLAARHGRRASWPAADTQPSRDDEPTDPVCTCTSSVRRAATRAARAPAGPQHPHATDASRTARRHRFAGTPPPGATCPWPARC